MDQRHWRAVYALEFFVALPAIYTVWSQVGGQGHLDQMDWRWKLGIGVALAYASVKATAAAVAGERAWNARALRWISIVLALAAAAVVVTYYYHLYESPEEEESVARYKMDSFSMPFRMASSVRPAAAQQYTWRSKPPEKAAAARIGRPTAL
jgi:hypothetical protein